MALFPGMKEQFDKIEARVQRLEDETRVITPQQEKIADMMSDIGVTIERALPKDDATKLNAQVNSIIAYLDIVHEDLQQAREFKKVPKEMLNFLSDTKQQMMHASTPAKLASMSASRGIDMEAYNQGCYDTIDRFIKHFMDVVVEIEQSDI